MLCKIYEFSFNCVEGINQWYYGLTVEDVDYYGQISNVEIKDASSSTWTAGQRQDYNVFLWQATGNGLQTPISVRVTDSHGNQVEGDNVVTSFTGNAKFDLGTNCMSYILSVNGLN